MACGFVIEFADIITQEKFNSTATSVGGWKNSEIRSYVNSVIFNSLPSDLQNVILDIKVVSGHGSAETSNFETQDKLYLLSAVEIWNNNISGYETLNSETRQLDYYSSNNVTLSNYGGAKKNYNGSPALVWVRSAYNLNNQYFLTVDLNGVWNADIATNSHGISPAFRIG